MSSLTGHGRKNLDLQARTLRCNDMIVIDKECNTHFSEVKGKSLQVRQNALVCGDLEVKGNIFGNVVGMQDGGGGTGATKYQFSTCFQAGGSGGAEAISENDASTINWAAAASFGTNGHMFNGPVGVPYDLTLLLVGDFVSPPGFDCQIVVQELSETQFNTASPGSVNTLAAMPLNTTAVNVVLTTNVTPTVTPAYWHYYCSNGSPQGPTTSIRSVHVVEQ
jgi:hypothetical protein